MFDMMARLSTIAAAVRMCAETSSAGDAAETLTANREGMPVDKTPTKYSPGPYLEREKRGERESRKKR